MLALRNGQDTTVADWAHGPKDIVQRVRREVQVGPAGARVQARSQPDFRANKALQLAPQGAGAAEAEGDGAGSAAPAVPTTTSSSEYDV